MNYILKLPYDPFKYPQEFTNYMEDIQQMDFINNEDRFYDLRLKYRQRLFSKRIFKELRDDLSEITMTRFMPYIDLLTIFTANTGFASFSGTKLTAYSDASRSFTDICALAITYDIIKEKDEILPLFIQMMKLFDLDMIQAGYCTTVDSFVFFPTVDPREEDGPILNFGGWYGNKKDLVSEQFWPFIKTINTEIIIGDGEPSYTGYDEDVDMEEDDDWYELR